MVKRSRIFDLTGHRQVTDTYLLGLARHQNGKLATFDRAIAGLPTRGEQKLIELVRGPEDAEPGRH